MEAARVRISTSTPENTNSEFTISRSTETHIIVSDPTGQISGLLRYCQGRMTFRCLYAQGSEEFVFQSDGKTVNYSERGTDE